MIKEQKTGEVAYGGLEFNIAFTEYHPPLWVSFWHSDNFFTTYKRLTGTDVGLIYICKNSELAGYMQAGAEEVIYESIKGRLTKNWIDHELALFEENLLKLQSFVKGHKLSIRTIEEFLDIVSALYPYSNAFFLLSWSIEKVIKKKLEATRTRAEVDAIILAATKPLRPTHLEMLSQDLRTMVSDLKDRGCLISTKEQVEALYNSDPHAKKALDDLAMKYTYLTSLNGTPRTAASFFEEVATTVTALKKESQGSVSVPEEIATEFYVMRAIAYYKDELSSWIVPFVRFAQEDELRKMAKELEIDRDTLDQLDPKDIVSGLSPDKLVELAAARRLATFIFHAPFEPAQVCEGAVAQEKMSAMVHRTVDQSSLDVSELTGNIGSQGKAQGKVRILRSASEIGTFETGEVLVAVYTAPDFVPAMKKAAAIVTDTGGVTSHAAIVARELGLPCIVGTKIATKVLKDGDLVEVDAARGIVRKI